MPASAAASTSRRRTSRRAPSPVTPSHARLVEHRGVTLSGAGRAVVVAARPPTGGVRRGDSTRPSWGGPKASRTRCFSQRPPLSCGATSHAPTTTAHWSARPSACQSSKARVGSSTSCVPVEPAPRSPAASASSNRWSWSGRTRPAGRRRHESRGSPSDRLGAAGAVGGRSARAGRPSGVRARRPSRLPTLSASAGERVSNVSAGGWDSGTGPAATSSSSADIARTGRSAVERRGVPPHQTEVDELSQCGLQG